MLRLAPLMIGLVVATVFAGGAAVHIMDAAGNITATSAVPANAGRAGTSKPAGQHADEPPHKALIRCLGDVDNLLDTIRGAASFAEAKPIILRRVRQHAAEAAAHPNPGMGRLSRTAAKELQAAMERHAQAMLRAEKVAPGVVKFFERDVTDVLSPK